MDADEAIHNACPPLLDLSFNFLKQFDGSENNNVHIHPLNHVHNDGNQGKKQSTTVIFKGQKDGD